MLELKNLYDDFRDPNVIKSFANRIAQKVKKIDTRFNIMEVCGGHTHTIMKYGLKSILPDNIDFVHGPGCPVCIMPKERIEHAIALAKAPNVILATLGDMIRVPSKDSSLAKVRAEGADVRSLYTPMDIIKIAKENPDKDVIFFAIGFETTTPMSAAIVDIAIKQNIKNIYFHINHVMVPPAIDAIMSDGEAQVDAFIGPAHVSVITGAKIYHNLSKKYNTPIAVSGFEPVDVIQSVDMLLDMKLQNRLNETDIQYTRSVTYDGNLKAQSMIDKYFEIRDSFRWRGIGDIPHSALKLRDEYASLDAEVKYKDILNIEPIDDHKSCICGTILKGLASPKDCKVFAKVCTPTNPLGSCMVSDEGACNAYYRFAQEEL
jgi:hydrogenase expression/formation protein HypD